MLVGEPDSEELLSNFFPSLLWPNVVYVISFFRKAVRLEEAIFECLFRRVSCIIVLLLVFVLFLLFGLDFVLGDNDKMASKHQPVARE